MACRALNKEASIDNMGGTKWTIRPMREEDIDKTLLIWSKVELTEARQTVVSALAADPLGFYVAELDETGEVIGMCTGPMTRTDTAFIGFYAVEPDYQGIGIGRELWARTLGRLEPTINVGLHGVPSMTEKYKRSGFTIEDSTRMLIFESKPHAGRELNLSALNDTDKLDSNCRLEILDGSERSEPLLRKLIDYDHSVQRFSREKLLKLYLRGDDVPLTFVIVKDSSLDQLKTNTSFSEQQLLQHGATDRRSSCCAKPSQESIIEDETLSTTTKSSLSLSTTAGAGQCCNEAPFRSSSPIDIPSIVSSTTTTASTEPGAVGGNLTSTEVASSITTTMDPSALSAAAVEVLGYGCIKHDNNDGGMIGPIYADSSELCEILLRNLISRFELKTGQISVMALSSNRQACKILTKLGLIEMEQCSRMFTKFVPAASLSKIYYIHSPNFNLS